MNAMHILKGFVSAAVLMSGCSHQMDPERDRRAASRAFDDNDSDAIPPSARAQVPPKDTYCDTEYLRLNPGADCRDYERRTPDDSMTTGR